MNDKYLHEAKGLFHGESRAIFGSPPKPCSENEISLLEQRIGHPLPKAYREFLLWAGHGAGHLMQGSDFYYDDLDGLREAAVELLQEDNIFQRLPSNAFVFYMHQGYQFAYFLLGHGDDPPIYAYVEGQDEPEFPEQAPSYSVFLYQLIRDTVQPLKELRSHRELYHAT